MSAPVLLGLVNIFELAAIGSLMAFVPALGRRDLFFAVTVDPEFAISREALMINSRYRRGILWQMLGWILLASCLVWLGARMGSAAGSWLMIAITIVSPFGLLAGCLVTFISARNGVLPHAARPSRVFEAPLRKTREPLSAAGRLFRLGPFLLIAASALYLRLRWEEIPGRFPTHWNAAGQADGWGSRSVLGTGIPLLIAACVNLFIMGITRLMSSQARSIYPSGEAAEHELAARRINGNLIITICYFVSLICCAIAVWLPFRAHPEQMPGVLILGSILAELVLMVGLFVMIGKAGGHMEKARKAALAAGGSGAKVIGDRTDDRHWKWGLFYCNSDDPAVWVEKRYGIGWTTNMARWQSWVSAIIFILGLGALIATIYFVTRN